MNIPILLFTITPTILILSFFYFSDKFKEPKQTILTVFYLGFLICLPAGILNDLSYNFTYDGSDFSERLAWSFLGPAWAEELLKFSILYLIVLKREEFNEKMDGIVYGVVVSLGFATYENYTYIYQMAPLTAEANDWSIEQYSYYVAKLRSYSAVPMHGLNGAVMGLFFSKYVFSGKKRFLILSLLFPYLFHGFYNYLDWPYAMFVIGTLFIFVLVTHKMIEEEQMVKRKEGENKKI
tara:strand:- start:2586 stop:3296 length:711 start_codon:yes stop_codon:yes gene_type:complete